MADLIDKAAAVKIAIDLAVGIEKEEAEALGWGGPDPRGYHARGIMLDQAKAFRRLADAIAALPAQGVRVKPPKLHISGDASTSTSPPADGWHITISRYGVPSVMRVEGGTAFIWHDFETGMREWAGVAAPEPGKEVMPNDENSIDARSATSPGVTAGAVEAMVKAAAQDAREVFDGYGSKAREAIDYMEQVALAAIREGKG